MLCLDRNPSCAVRKDGRVAVGDEQRAAGPCIMVNRYETAVPCHLDPCIENRSISAHRWYTPRDYDVQRRCVDIMPRVLAQELSVLRVKGAPIRPSVLAVLRLKVVPRRPSLVHVLLVKVASRRPSVRKEWMHR